MLLSTSKALYLSNPTFQLSNTIGKTFEDKQILTVLNLIQNSMTFYLEMFDLYAFNSRHVTQNFDPKTFGPKTFDCKTFDRKKFSYKSFAHF